MQLQRFAVTKRVGTWGSIYIIGGTEADGETLPSEQADDIIARFEHEQALFAGALSYSLELGSALTMSTPDGDWRLEIEMPRPISNLQNEKLFSLR